MKITVAVMTVLCGALIVAECSAEPPGKPDGKRGPNANGQQRGNGQRPGNGADPAQMVMRMMKQFDKDGDQKLDVRELTTMLKAMRERRADGGGRPGANGQKPGNNGPRGQKPGAGQPRRRPGEDRAKENKAGGDRPAKPGGGARKRPAPE